MVELTKNLSALGSVPNTVVSIPISAKLEKSYTPIPETKIGKSWMRHNAKFTAKSSINDRSWPRFKKYSQPSFFQLVALMPSMVETPRECSSALSTRKMHNATGSPVELKNTSYADTTDSELRRKSPLRPGMKRIGFGVCMKSSET